MSNVENLKEIIEVIYSTCKSDSKGSMNHDTRSIPAAIGICINETQTPSPADGTDKRNKRKRRIFFPRTKR